MISVKIQSHVLICFETFKTISSVQFDQTICLGLGLSTYCLTQCWTFKQFNMNQAHAVVNIISVRYILKDTFLI